MGNALSDNLELVIHGLAQMGFRLQPREGSTGFLNGVRIDQGVIQYDPCVVQPSDILHEAGHLAVIPAQFRSLATGNMARVQDHMLTHVERLIEEDMTVIDSPLVRAVMQSGDPEATAWAFAAGREIGIPDDVVILDDEYDGEGEFVRMGLAMNAYVGINGLVAGGMCASTRAFPTLTRWRQP